MGILLGVGVRVEGLTITRPIKPLGRAAPAKKKPKPKPDGDPPAEPAPKPTKP